MEQMRSGRKKQITKIANVLRLIFFDWQTLLGFEIVYKLVSVSVFVPLIKLSLNGIMRLSGYGYLTAENVKPFLRSPIAILYALVVFLLLIFYSMIDTAAIIYILDRSKRRLDTSAFDALRFGLRKSIDIFHLKNLPVAMEVILLIPLTNIGLFTGYILTVEIPDYFYEYFFAHRGLVLAAGIAFLILEVAMHRWLYCFHYYCLEDCSFRLARRKSVVTGPGIRNRIIDILWVVGAQALLTLTYLLLAVVGIFLIFSGCKVVGVFYSGYIGYDTIIFKYLTILLELVQVFAVPVGYAMITARFYLHREEGVSEPEGAKRQSVDTQGAEAKSPRSFKRRRIETFLLIATIGLFTWYSWRSAKGVYNINIETLHNMEVTAHRGASEDYPENTMAAFIGAVEQGTDWIELDVQQSRDGQIFVMHDTSFKRTTGVDARSWELDWEEIRELDAGSWFSEEFAGEKVPLLEEVLLLARLTGVRLNIELKPTGHETDFEAEIVRLIQDFGMGNDCVVTSQDYTALVNIKAADENIRTVYVMSVAFGDLTQLSSADDFSIESTFATSALIRRLHQAGRRVYVWTVNSRKSIRSALANGADNIITDNVPLANQCIDEAQTGSGMRILIEMMRDLLAT